MYPEILCQAIFSFKLNKKEKQKGIDVDVLFIRRLSSMVSTSPSRVHNQFRGSQLCFILSSSSETVKSIPSATNQWFSLFNLPVMIVMKIYSQHKLICCLVTGCKILLRHGNSCTADTESCAKIDVNYAITNPWLYIKMTPFVISCCTTNIVELYREMLSILILLYNILIKLSITCTK